MSVDTYYMPLCEVRDLCFVLVCFCDFDTRLSLGESCEEMGAIVKQLWVTQANTVLEPFGVKASVTVAIIRCGNEELLQSVEEMEEDFFGYLPQCVLYFGKAKGQWMVAKFSAETNGAAVFGWTHARERESFYSQRPISKPLCDAPPIDCSLQWSALTRGSVTSIAQNGELVAISTTTGQLAILKIDTGHVVSDTLEGEHIAFVSEDRIIGLWTDPIQNVFLAEYCYCSGVLRRENDRVRIDVDTVESMKASVSGKSLFINDSNKQQLAEYSTSDWAFLSCVPLSGFHTPVGQCDIGSNGVWAQPVFTEDGYGIEMVDCTTRCSTQTIATLHSAAICQVAFSPNCTRIVSVSMDTSVQLFDAVTKEMIGAPRFGHTNYVTGVCWLTDERFVTVSDDKSVIVWHKDSQKFIHRIENAHDHYSSINCVLL